MEQTIELLLEMAALAIRLAWPVVAAAALYWYREPLTRFLEGLGQRVTKLALFEFAIELATMPEYAPVWKIGADDVRRLTSAQVFDSGTQTLFEQMAIQPGSDYAVVDLGFGNQWLTSRLYIFALMLARMRNLRCFVFVHTRGEVYRRFLGVATPEAIRWALARRYPWLEHAYINAQHSLYAGDPASLSADASVQILSDYGSLDWYRARQLVNQYVTLIQQSVAPPSETQTEWEELEAQPPTPALWERTEWITVPLLADLLSGVMDEAHVEDSPDLPSQMQAAAIARRPAPFVALVDKERVFHALVDRQVLLEKLAVHFAEGSEK
jgi:hypothetical protein